LSRIVWAVSLHPPLSRHSGSSRLHYLPRH